MAERMQEIITLSGGMTTDLSRNVMPNNVASFLKNAITDYNNTVNNGQGQSRNIGVVTPVVSTTTNFDYELPEGQNICIGAKYDRKLNQLFWFNYNSNSDHQFWLYDANTNAFTLVWQDALFNFSLRNLITSIDVVIADISTPNVNVQNLQRLVYWTDGYNQPRKMNVDRAISGGYSSLTDLRSPDEFMLAVKYPPLDVDVTNTLPNPDPSYILNFVANKEFQFRYRYYYEDGEHSTWSAISSFTYSTVTEKNFIELTMSAGSSLVTNVELAFNQWEGVSGAWKSYDIILRDAITANVVYPYDVVTNTFIYKFFNNQAYNLLDQDDTNRPFDTLPLKAEAQEFVEQNVLLYANVLQGYNNLDPTELVKPTIDIQYADYEGLELLLDVHFTNTITAGTLTVTVHKTSFATGIDTVIHTEAGINTSPFDFTYTATNIAFGDLIYLSWSGLGTVTNGTSLTGTYSNILFPLSASGDFEVTKNAGAQAANGVITMTNVVSDPLDTWSTSTSKETVPYTTTGYGQLKQGGKYKIGLICYDDALRSTFVQFLPNCIANIESIQEAEAYQTFTITIDWNSIVLPSWVKYVKLCRTKNLNLNRELEQGYLQTTIQDVEFLDYDGTPAAPNANTKNVRFTLSELIDFNTNNFENTTTTYTWTKNDRIQFIRNGDGSYFDFATYGLIDEILSTDPAAVDVNYMCPYNAGLSGLIDGAWVELYTPAKETQTDKYYEFGDFIPTEVVNNENVLTATTTIVTTFDTYAVFWSTPYVLALVNDSGATPFEHHSIFLTGTVPSSGEDIGRFNVVNADARQLWYPAKVVWSNAYLPNTYWNGLSTFKEQNEKMFFRQYGGIVQLHSEQTRLLILQEDNHFRAMLAKKLVTLADGSVMVITSDEFISDPIEINGYFGGCQNSESFVEWNGLMFWNDVKRGAWCECNWQDTVDIAMEGMNKSYSENKDKYLFRYNQNEHTTQTCCWNMNGWTSLAIGDQIKVTSGGVVTTITVEEPITTLEDIASLLEVNGFGEFTANDLNQSICTTDNDNDLSELDIVYMEAEEGFRMLYDDIANTPVADPSDVADWNTFFDLPANGDVFTSVVITGNEVKLLGGGGMTITTELFMSVSTLLEVHDDSGCVVACEDGAFYGNGSLVIVELNSCVTFANGCFDSCVLLTDFSATSALTLGETCFANCNTLTAVNIPLVESIGESCFFYCLSLSSIVANNATSIGDTCFMPCVSLTNISLLSCVNLGVSTADNGVFSGITGKTISFACPPALLTCDGGDPDGDIVYLQANNTVTINDEAGFAWDNFFAVSLHDTPIYPYKDNSTWLAQIADVGFSIGQNIVGADSNWEHSVSRIGGFGFVPDNVPEAVVTPRVGIGAWVNEIQNYNPDSAMVLLQQDNNDTGVDFLTEQMGYVVSQGQTMIFMVNVCHGTVSELIEFYDELIAAGVTIAEFRLGSEVSTSSSSGTPNTSMTSAQYIAAITPFIEYIQYNYGGIPITVNAAKRNFYTWSNDDLYDFCVSKGIKLFSQYLWLEATSSETNQDAYFNDLLTKLRANLYDDALLRVAGYYTTFSGMSFRIGQGGTNDQLSGKIEGTMLQAIMLYNLFFELWDYNKTHNDFVSGFTFLTNTKAVNRYQGKDALFSINSYFTSTDGINTFVTRTTGAAYQLLSVIHNTTDTITYIEVTLTGAPSLLGAAGFQVGGYVYVFIYNAGAETTISTIKVDAAAQTNTTRETIYGNKLYSSIGTCPAFNLFGGTPSNVDRVEGAISAANVVIKNYSITKLFLTDVSGATTIELIWS